MGGPQVASGTQLLMGGAVDFFMGYGIDAVNAIAQGMGASQFFAKRVKISQDK